ncbi:MAG: efflux RND transporter periplasmic adaptor subunit [Desulfobacterales bacterium]
MNRTKWIIMIILVMSIIVLGAGYFLLFSKSPELPAESNISRQSPVAKVQVTPIKKETIMETITAYGTVAPEPGAVETISVPFESRIRRILVSEGQKISKGDILLDIDPSPAAKLQVAQAQRAYTSAEQKLRKVQERVDLKLATSGELLAAEEVFQQAGLQLKSLEQRGIGRQKQIRSKSSGIVYKVHVEQGSVMPGGTPLVEIVPQDRIEVHLGVEQDDVDRLKQGQPVLLSLVNISQSSDVSGHIRTISRSVNPVSRLVNIFVSLTSPDSFFLGGYVRGKIVIASKKTMVVPSNAVLPEDDHYVLFIVQNGRALKRIVTPGLENHTRIEVAGKGLNLGDLVVDIGNYELEDGMAVQAEVLK